MLKLQNFAEKKCIICFNNNIKWLFVKPLGIVFTRPRQKKMIVKPLRALRARSLSSSLLHNHQPHRLHHRRHQGRERNIRSSYQYNYYIKKEDDRCHPLKEITPVGVAHPTPVNYFIIIEPTGLPLRLMIPVVKST